MFDAKKLSPQQLSYLGIFLAIYVSIWLSQYFAYRRKIEKINRNLPQ